MTTELSDHQFELLPSEDSSEGVVFGKPPSYADHQRIGHEEVGETVAENLVPNPSFEVDAAGWEVGGNLTPVTRVPLAAENSEGSWAGMVEPDGSGQPPGGASGFLVGTLGGVDGIPVSPGESLSISARGIRTGSAEVPTNLRLLMLAYDSNGAWVQTFASVNVPTSAGNPPSLNTAIIENEVVPDGAAFISLRWYRLGGDDGTGWTTGQLNIDAHIIVKSPTLPSDGYFDGDTPRDGDVKGHGGTYEYAWTGEPHASTSIRRKVTWVSDAILPGISLDENGFEPGGTEWSVQDQINPRHGVTQFGRDRLTGPDWAWELFVNADDEISALEEYGKLATAWRAANTVDTPGAMSVLRYRAGGRVRRILGRPRRWVGKPNNRILSGMMPIVADFKAVDAYHYDDTPQEVILDLTSPGGGGFTFPVVFPIVSAPSGSRDGSIFVGGDADAEPTIRLEGPLSSITVETDYWSLDYNASIPEGSYVVIDTRPWALSVLLNGQKNVSTNLGRRQWLEDIKLRPGHNEIRLAANSSTGAGRCKIGWFNKWNSL